MADEKPVQNDAPQAPKPEPASDPRKDVKPREINAIPSPLDIRAEAKKTR
jgi:hypothetical protein